MQKISRCLLVSCLLMAAISQTQAQHQVDAHIPTQAQTAASKAHVQSHPFNVDSALRYCASQAAHTLAQQPALPPQIIAPSQQASAAPTQPPLMPRSIACAAYRQMVFLSGISTTPASPAQGTGVSRQPPHRAMLRPPPSPLPPCSNSPVI